MQKTNYQLTANGSTIVFTHAWHQLVLNDANSKLYFKGFAGFFMHPV